jgi:simple sugar transport system substrate-binding protein
VRRCRARRQVRLISHAPDSDSWWNTIKNSIKQAGEDYGVQVDYRNPPSGDLADMARLIEQAAAAGLRRRDHDDRRLQRAAGRDRQGHRQEDPLITINSGTVEQSEKLGALMHVGQPEYAAGKGAGEKRKAAGVKSFLCVNHYATNPRASSAAAASVSDRRRLQEVTLDSGDDPTTIESKVARYLRQNPSTNGVLTLGPTSASPTIRALEKVRPGWQAVDGDVRPVRRHQQGHQVGHRASSRSTSSRTCRATSRSRCSRR